VDVGEDAPEPDTPAPPPDVEIFIPAQRRGCLRPLLILLVVVGILWLVALVHDGYTWSALRERARAVRIGMTHDEVLAAMGKPDQKANPDRWKKEEWDSWWYRARRLFWHDREVRIDFDPERVNGVEEQPYEQIPFDSADWKRSSALRRGFMIDDLLERHALRRMNRAAVVELLGEPPESSMGGGGDLVWCLGPQRSSLFPVDDDWLVINLNEDGSVKSVVIISD